MSLWSRLTNALHPQRVERELDAELQFHLEERIRELVESGMTPKAAAREARKRFGNTLQLRERSRDVKLFSWLETVVGDARLAARRLRKDGVVTLAAVASLAVALGACAAAFSLVDALILKPLPVRHPEQLVYFTFPNNADDGTESSTFNYPLFKHLRETSPDSIELFAMSTQVMRPAIFDGPGNTRDSIRAQHVGGNAFSILGATAAAGRLIGGADDEQPGVSPVAVISHAFWMRRFGGDPAVIGRWFTLETAQLQIVGVAEPRFTGVEAGRPTDVWLPMMMYNRRAFENPSQNWFRLFGRITDDTQRSRIAGAMQTAFTSFRRAQPVDPRQSPAALERYRETPLHLRSAVNGPSPLRQQFERPLWIVSATALLVLFIAGSNIANLLLARTASREREMSLRLSIGAGRGRLIQQVFVESALVAAAACAAGLFIALITAPAIVAMLATPDDPLALNLQFDWRFAGFAAALTLLTTTVFALAPALRASSVAPMTALRSGDRRSGTRTTVMRPFVTLQVAFSLMVLFVGGLLVTSFSRLMQVDPGFNADHALVLSLDTASGVDPVVRRAALFQTLDRLAEIPGVESVSAAELGVLGRAWTHNVLLPNSQYDRVQANMKPVSDGFFDALGIRLIDGRVFTRQDMSSGSPAIVVSESFARLYFGSDRAIGRKLQGRFGNDAVQSESEVVGIVADSRHDVREQAGPTLYIPIRPGQGASAYVRTRLDAGAVASRLRDVVHATSPMYRVSSITPQSTIVGETLLRERLLAILSGVFAVVGLILAAVGLYGVLSYSVVQRTREIGVRIALGARVSSVVKAVLLDAGITTLAGIACGLAGGLYASRFVASLLFDVVALDVWSITLPLGALLAAALLASILPAWRAARVNPVIALRHE